jgi:hypothetical protein
MPSTPSFTLDELRHLDELVDDWALWHCAKVRPGKVKGSVLYKQAVDSGRQWQPLSEVCEKIARATSAIVDVAIDDMARNPAGVEHKRVLETYAALHFHRRYMGAVVRSNRVTEDQIEVAKHALVPYLRAHGVW